MTASDVAKRQAQDLDELTERVSPGRRRVLGSLGPAPLFEDFTQEEPPGVGRVILGEYGQPFAGTIVEGRPIASLPASCARHGFDIAGCPGCDADLAMLSEPRP